MITPAFAADQLLLPWPVVNNEPATAYAYDQAPRSQPFWPPRGIDWRGFYVGGQFAYSDANANFSAATQGPIAYGLRETTLENQFTPSNWPVLGTASHGTTGFGGFVGYNTEYLTQSAKIVFGLEANYDQASLSVTAPNSPISRITPADTSGNKYLVNITGSGTVTDLDFGTLRARAGWALGNFLPYAFVGGALGRANVNINATVSGEVNPPTSGPCSSSNTPPCVPFSFSGSAGKNSEFLYGLTAGTGIDVALTQNIFLRAEYEFVEFQKVANTGIWINTVRAGAGIKF
ncbi:MAG TPA: outer membrane beta-barrel protein [Xanthobacteraceae bacterium]|nr:outer membrane beta-barrel protein [Xanthobacteraceae bacterium]